MTQIDVTSQEVGLSQRRSQMRWQQIVIYAFILAGAVVMLIPLLWLLSSSFKDTARIFLYPPQWIPDPWRFDNYTPNGRLC